jgi:hypothetical protein
MKGQTVKRIPICLTAGLLAAVVAAGPAAAASEKAATPKTIVFIAGPKDHGAPGCHEYEKDLRVLEQCLLASPAGKDVRTRFFTPKAPRDVAELDGAATIVVHSSGDRKENETHALFPSNNGKDDWYSAEDDAYLKALDGLMQRGTGLVVMHYTLIVKDPRARMCLLKWVGGYHGDRSRVKMDKGEAVPAAPGHPILRGVEAWTTNHEYYFNQYIPKQERVTPILTAMLPSNKPEKHVIAWALERPGGGRGFAFTGGHFHRNLEIDGYRRMLLNAVLWTAKMSVPDGGVAAKPASK